MNGSRAEYHTHPLYEYGKDRTKYTWKQLTSLTERKRPARNQAAAKEEGHQVGGRFASLVRTETHPHYAAYFRMRENGAISDSALLRLMKTKGL